MARYKIPRTLGAVRDQLGQIGELLKATEWTRAALLASIVRLPGRGTRREEAGSSFFTAEEFSELGIAGLRSKDTVRLYVQRWLDANDGTYPELGKAVELPDLDWPPSRTGTDGFESEDGARKTIEKIVAKHGAEAVANVIVDTPALDNAVSRTRLDRVSTPAERRQLAERGEQRSKDLETDITANRAALADHTQHQAELEAMGARMHLRRAAKAMESNPYVSPTQREGLAEVLQECAHLIDMITQGASGWGSEDHRFLASIGVDGSDA